jgi:molybdenum cofactor cytidylyltransferase
MIRGILLAGGASTRFGSHKLLHGLDDGASIGVRSAGNLIAGVGNALAVVRPGDDRLAALLRAAGCDILVTPRALEGMGGSLAAAISAASDAAGWVVALADMPFIQPDTIRSVQAALTQGAIIAAPILNSTGERGHPVGFRASLADELMLLSGDQGARAVIGKYHADLVAIATDDRGVVRDVDVPDDVPAPKKR